MDEKTIKKALNDVLEEKFTQFFVPPERHYQEHLWLRDLMCWTNKIKSSALKTIVTSIVGGIITLLIIGFVVFSGKSGP